MAPISDHPLRMTLANELHARPFPVVTPPCRAAYLAIKPARSAAGRDRQADLDHLIALLDHYAAPHPEAGATHYSGPIGRFTLKWESHTEFVTFTIFADGAGDTPFAARDFDVFPDGWLSAAPGTRVTSALILVEVERSDEDITDMLADWFVPESVAVSNVLDGSAVIAGDFRIDPAGHIRFAVFARSGAGARRVGRIVQRLCEIETYKAMSMLGLSRSREVSRDLVKTDEKLTELTAELAGREANAETTLAALIDVSGRLENIGAQASFRFGATRAYEAIVSQRIKVLREETFHGGQTFGEFMMRRFDPAMRTIKATERRLEAMTRRAQRAADLLRTKVEVDRSAQNQMLLKSMDRRADLQLRLQKTVEGLSVVAISYYAVNLVLYAAAPLVSASGVSKPVLTAIATPLVILVVWWSIRRLRRHVEMD